MILRTIAINIQWIQLYTPEPHPTVETSPSSPALVLSPVKKVKIYTETKFIGSSEIDAEPSNLGMIHCLKSAPPHLQPIFPLPVEIGDVSCTGTFLTFEIFTPEDGDAGHRPAYKKNHTKRLPMERKLHKQLNCTHLPLLSSQTRAKYFTLSGHPPNICNKIRQYF